MPAVRSVYSRNVGEMETAAVLFPPAVLFTASVCVRFSSGKTDLRTNWIQEKMPARKIAQRNAASQTVLFQPMGSMRVTSVGFQPPRSALVWLALRVAALRTQAAARAVRVPLALKDWLER